MAGFMLITSGSARAAVTNLQVDADFYEFDGVRVAFTVSEADESRADLNADGDTDDHVLHLYEPASGDTVNVGLATDTFRLDHDRVALAVSEAAQGGQDMNGDGDALDRVLHLYDAASGETVNLGLGVSGLGVDSRLELQGDLVAFAVDEGTQGDWDLNDDGDTDDDVLHVHDVASGETVNLGLDTSDPHLQGDLVAFSVYEGSQGERDLNRDGDVDDSILHVYNAARGETVNLRRAAYVDDVEGGMLAFLVYEQEQGGRDLNRDGDSDDGVVHIYDAARGRTVNLKRAGSVEALEGGLLVFSVGEKAQGGRDFNGDGDPKDLVLHLYRAANQRTVNLRLAAGVGDMQGNLLSLYVSEGQQGERDLNRDGDAADEVLHVFNAASGRMVNVSLHASFFSDIEAGRIAFSVYETAQGGRDLNGDRDADDYVLHLYRIASGRTVNLGLAAYRWELESSLLAFLVEERDQGRRNLNGDRDAKDRVLHVRDRTGRVVNLRLAVPDDFRVSIPHQLKLVGRRVAFLVHELAHGGRDLNGDGDANDVVLHVYNGPR
jgi:hypothetical protein